MTAAGPSQESLREGMPGQVHDPVLQLRNLGVCYTSSTGKQIEAVANFNLGIAAGEFISILGPSGCGKSTVLQCLGGLTKPTSGAVIYDRQPINRPDAERAALVFQEYSLLPWLTVAENAAIGLRFRRVRKSERRRVALAKLRALGLESVADSYPAELSGGMQQRVAVARALAVEPSVLLLDEPFGALDEQSRRWIGYDLARALTETGCTVVLVTHSIDEAVFWADRVVLMSRGPGRITEVIDVPEVRPRPLEFMTSQMFDDIRAHLFGRLMEADNGQH